MIFFLRFIGLLCEVLTLAVLIRVIFSWFSPVPNNMLTNILYQITEPFL
ncbi:YggT family protein, partial [Chloroflexota bacterium]